ncbi:hypothetical protein P0092_00565 [Ruminiclostridium papyrosolvens DSM 2782]|uniref:hypothetical protein n=1 Tax=Ruminiclostridium papyrosolvens TaxID=29362 RepID=UPI001FA74832|nr:hypothetical protein [Ruminiclostridium papyrosolvens]WES34504.1 hypothetical protein P0092_00565 [Ruminiclostridium papyrosolvens DSM 2782]
MKKTNYTTGQKLHAELKKTVARIKNTKGGGLGVLFIGLAVTFLVLLVFVSAADYAVYTYKRNSVSKAMDYAVTAAVQNINKDKSLEGLSEGFDENTGTRLTDGIEINIDKAETTFLSVFEGNSSQRQTDIKGNLLICATSVSGGDVDYRIKTSSGEVIAGKVETPYLIEDRINAAAKSCWPDSYEGSSRIFINSNPKSNMIEKGTYLFAYIKGIKITGIFTQRKLALSCFGGAKLERANVKTK